MTSKGIRISDRKNGKCIPLSELLCKIPDPSDLKWSLLWLHATSNENEGKFVTEISEIINSSQEGYYCDFNFLCDISYKLFQEIDILIIGCKESENLHRYNTDEQMYNSCEITIEMIDGGFWEVFSKMEPLIQELNKVYKKTELIIPNLM